LNSKVEEVAPYCSELDDFKAEQREVITDQGTAFPFTRGFWLVCQLCAAVYPDDLDAIDESLPFSKYTLDLLLGRTHTTQEYRYYFERNPHAILYVDQYMRLRDEPAYTRNIIPLEVQRQREDDAGYINGQRPEGKKPQSVAALLEQYDPHGSELLGASTTSRSIFSFGKKA
jgi:hypothetical protein